MIYVGDLSYADSDEPRWDSWQQLVAPVSSHMPWMVTAGNHEIEIQSDLETFVAYKARFSMPHVYPGTPNQTTTLYYAFELGPVTFIMLGSYADVSNGGDQYTWLQSVIKGIDRTVTPWVFVGLHAPWYNSNKAHQGEGEAMRQVFEDTLYDAGVDLVLAGHVHAYERFYRVHNNAKDGAGPYYITIGDGGNREGLASTWLTQPAISAFRQASYGHSEVTVFNSTHALWSWHQNPDLEPTVADELWIVKGGNSDAAVGPRTLLPVFRRQ